MTLKPQKNPYQLFPHNCLTMESTDSSPWRIAHTRSRHEKSLANFFYARKISYYLPLAKKRQNSKNRTRHSLVPLFQGYIFFKADNALRHEAMKSNCIASILEVSDQNLLIRELTEIQAALTLDAPIYPYDFVHAGQEVEIRKGPMKGLKGIIIRKDKNFRLVLKVSGIFQAAAINIDSDWVEPALKSS